MKWDNFSIYHLTNYDTVYFLHTVKLVLGMNYTTQEVVLGNIFRYITQVFFTNKHSSTHEHGLDTQFRWPLVQIKFDCTMHMNVYLSVSSSSSRCPWCLDSDLESFVSSRKLASRPSSGTKSSTLRIICSGMDALVTMPGSYKDRKTTKNLFSLMKSGPSPSPACTHPRSIAPLSKIQQCFYWNICTHMDQSQSGEGITASLALSSQRFPVAIV